MGIDTTDPGTIDAIRKRSTTRDDLTACRLLRAHGIHPVIGHIVGFGDESWADLRRARRALAAYDGDYLNAMYVTPHRWTQFAAEQADRPVVQEDLGRWDYRHQVLAQQRLAPWQLFAAVKWLELRFHLRPRRLRRLLLAGDRADRREAWWAARHTGMVWLMEIVEFVRRVRFARRPRPLHELTGDTGTGTGVGVGVSAAGPAGTEQATRHGTGRKGADDGGVRGLQQRLLARF